MPEPQVRYESGVTGKKADVYRNLQVGGYSIRSRETETYGTVIGHKDSIVMKDVEFVVQEGGRQKVLEEERKNVHAVVRGRVVSQNNWSEEADAVPITYNPYEYAHFVHVETEKPVVSAELVYIHSNGVSAVGVEYLEE